MTLIGTAHKTALLLMLATVSAAFAWTQMRFTAEGAMIGGTPFILLGGIGGAVVGVLTVLRKDWAPVTAPIYAVLKGLALGAISAWSEFRYGGIVLQAVMLTFGTLLALLLAYRSGLVRPTENFKLGLLAATGGVAVVYLASFLLGLAGHQIPLIHESGPVGIGFSLVVVAIAALNLVLDFDFIETGCEQRAPKALEWYGAFGLMVTLVWLYLEFLRLLTKTRSRD